MPVRPERHGSVGTRRDQIPHIPPRRRAKIHRSDHARVDAERCDRRARLQVPDAQDAVQRSGGQQRVLQVDVDVGDLGGGAAERGEEAAGMGGPQFY